MSTTTIKLPRNLGWIKADFAQASDPIIWIDDQGYEDATVFQVADFQHSRQQAKHGVARWLESQGG